MPETKETRKVKYFTKGMLIRANDEAIRTKRNRTLYPDKLETLPDLKFPVGMTFDHNGCELRVQITIGTGFNDLHSVWLDIPYETYNALPEAEVPA